MHLGIELCFIFEVITLVSFNVQTATSQLQNKMHKTIGLKKL